MFESKRIGLKGHSARLLWAASLIALAFVATAQQSALAQVPEGKARSFIEQAAKSLGIPPNSEYFKYIDASLRKSLSKDSGHGSYDVPEHQVLNLKVVAHHRSSSGIPFPSADELDIPELNPSQEVLDEAARAQVAFMERAAMETARVPELPDCNQSRTDVFDSANTPGLNDEFVFLDMLFIRKGQMPSDVKERFGKQVFIREYDPADPAALAAKTVEVSCLPYRIRVTGAHIYRIQGAAALDSAHTATREHANSKEANES